MLTPLCSERVPMVNIASCDAPPTSMKELPELVAANWKAQSNRRNFTKPSTTPSRDYSAHLTRLLRSDNGFVIWTVLAANSFSVVLARRGQDQCQFRTLTHL